MPAPIAGVPLRAVVDTNVIVSGVLNPEGAPGAVLDHWARGAFEAIVCGALLSEVARTLQKPHLRHRVTAHERTRVLRFIDSSSHFVPDNPPAGTVAADPDDDYLVALARTWSAALVTGDRHLLDLPGMPAIMRPSAFLRLLP